jgi:hypothetical protein
MWTTRFAAAHLGDGEYNRALMPLDRLTYPGTKREGVEVKTQDPLAA